MARTCGSRSLDKSVTDMMNEDNEDNENDSQEILNISDGLEILDVSDGGQASVITTDLLSFKIISRETIITRVHLTKPQVESLHYFCESSQKFMLEYYKIVPLLKSLFYIFFRQHAASIYGFVR